MQDNETPVWSVVDPLWYRSFYPIVDSLAGPEDTPATVYHQFGKQLGHSPNPYFHEQWYLSRYPDVEKTVISGAIPNGFSHFCEHGYRDRTPHWLFDLAYYTKQYEAFYNINFEDAGGGLYTHYLRKGQFEGLSGHFLFDPKVFEALSPYETVRSIQHSGPYTTYLSQLGLAAPESVTSNLFNPAWYLERYEGVKEAVAENVLTSALEHYLTNDSPNAYDPSPLFSEEAYLAAYEDVRAAIYQKQIRNGYEHYLLHGRQEQRPFFPSVAGF